MSNLLEPLLPYIAYLALFLRVIVGASLMVHGYPKLSGEGKKALIGFMRVAGRPCREYRSPRGDSRVLRRVVPDNRTDRPRRRALLRRSSSAR